MSKLNEPAIPVMDECEQHGQHYGFTMRERACIDLRIPETDDPELNALIEKARWRDVVTSIAAGLAANHTVSQSDADVEAVHLAENVMHQLERTDG